MEREGRIPPALAVGLIALVMVIGALAYAAGRFGRRGPARVSPAELPAPAVPVPAVAEKVRTPPDIPPTVTPSVPVLVEKGSRPSRLLVEKSSQIVVPLTPGPVPTAQPTLSSGLAAESPPPRRRIVVEVPATPRPQPTPTVPELQQGDENEEPAMEETPAAPEPTPRPQPRGSPASI